jgi:hypothetical protein
MRLDLPQKGRSGFLTDFGMVQDLQKQIKSSNAISIEWGGLARHERRWATALAPILGDVARIVGGPRQSEIVE